MLKLDKPIQSKIINHTIKVTGQSMNKWWWDSLGPKHKGHTRLYTHEMTPRFANSCLVWAYEREDTKEKPKYYL